MAAGRFTETVNLPSAPAIVVISDDPRVGPALVSYLSVSTDALAIEGPIRWKSLSDRIRPAVAVCDLDGTDLSAALERLVAMSRDRTLKVIAVSASLKARRAALDRGALYAADKTADMDGLIERVRLAVKADDS